MATSTLLAPVSTGSRFKTVLWVSLGLTVLFVFITSELLLITDYPMYHAYRLQVIADRGLLIPHTLAGSSGSFRSAQSISPRGSASVTFNSIAPQPYAS